MEIQPDRPQNIRSKPEVDFQKFQRIVRIPEIEVGILCDLVFQKSPMLSLFYDALQPEQCPHAEIGAVLQLLSKLSASLQS